MFNPLVDSLSDLPDVMLESKINDLQKKYFLTNNNDVRQQIYNLLDMYKQEQYSRAERSRQRDKDRGNPDLDDLIKVN